MAQLNVLIDTNLTKETLARDYQRPLSSKYADVQQIAQLLEKILSGNQPGTPPSVTVDAYEDANYATGSFTLTTAIATDAVSINNVTFTCVASGATGNQFNVGLTDTATAVNLAVAINGSSTALVDGYVVAEGSTNHVNLTSAFPGLAGNQTLIASADGTIVASSTRLTGGDADTNEKVYTF